MTQQNTVDGFYAGYFAGAEGNGLGLFVFKDGILAGVDASGVQFDGHYTTSEEGSYLDGDVTVKVPPNSILIQGPKTDAKGLVYQLNLHLQIGNSDIPFFRIETPMGPINLKLIKLREIA